MNQKQKVKIFRITLTVITLILIVGILIYLFPVMRNLSTEKGQIEFKNKIDKSGAFGVIILLGIQILQIFLFIIPGEPIEILAGMCYGTFWGTVFIIFSNFCVSTLIFLLVRRLGKRFVYNFSDKQKVQKILNSKLFQNPKKIEYILLILFLIPGTPKDLIVYISGLLPIKFSRFIIISTFARFPSVISSTLAGANIAVGDWKSSIILYATIIAMVAILVYIINKFDNDKTTNDIIKIMSEK